MQQNTFANLLSKLGSGAEVSVGTLLTGNTDAATMLSKLIRGDVDVQYDREGLIKPEQADSKKFQKITDRKMQDMRDSETAFEILPEYELISQVLISSILAPQDMVTTELIYTTAKGLLPQTVQEAMTQRLRKFFEEEYQLKPVLPTMLKDVLFKSGAYPIMVIPEAVLDATINVGKPFSMESHSDSKNAGIIDPNTKYYASTGLLGAGDGNSEFKPSGFNFSFESYNVPPTPSPDIVFRTVVKEGDEEKAITIDPLIKVCDHPAAVLRPAIMRQMRQANIETRLGINSAMESTLNKFRSDIELRDEQNGLGKLSDQQLYGKLYARTTGGAQPLFVMQQADSLLRHSVGNPLILKIPTEAVIPLIVPGSPEHHVGYLLVLDQEGNFITKMRQDENFQRFTANMTQQDNFASTMMQKVKTNLNGFDIRDREHAAYMTKLYATMIERDLMNRFRNGAVGDNVAIANREDVFRIMLARSFKGHLTQLVYVPKEMLTYMALDYDENGLGKSLMDGMKTLNAMRMMTMFANVMAAVKNSIGRTVVNFQLDPESPDPQKDIEILEHTFMNARSNSFPLGLQSPADLVQYLQRAGYEFTYTNHPGLPDVKVEVGERNSNYIKPDTDLEDHLRKASIMRTGLSPENIDAASNAEFAASINNNNLLLSKRVMNIQEAFMPQVSIHARSVIMNTPSIMMDLAMILKAHYKEIIQRIHDRLPKASGKIKINTKHLLRVLLREFVEKFELELPKPNVANVEAQSAAFQIYSDNLDKAIEYYFNSSFLNESTIGQLNVDLETIKSSYKATKMRKWMQDNGFMSDLGELVAATEEGTPNVDLQREFQEFTRKMAGTLGQFITNHKPIRDASTAVSNSVGDRGSQDSIGGGGDWGSDGGDGGDKNSDDGGLGDFNFDIPDFDLGGDDKASKDAADGMN